MDIPAQAENKTGKKIQLCLTGDMLGIKPVSGLGFDEL
jgi:hypothetical protein